MNGDVRPGADEPSVLEQLGFNVPSSSPPAPSLSAPSQSHLPPHARAQVAAPAGSTRREARELERGASTSRSGKPGKPGKQSKSAERRIRAVQKSYGKPKGRRGATVVVPSGSSRPTPTTTKSSSRARNIGSRILSVAAMVFAGALAVGMSVPANAFDNGSSGQSTLATGEQAQKVDGQTLDVASTVTTTSAARSEYTVTSWADMLRLQYGTRNYTYEMGDPNGPIRWPFPYPVPISSGFGERAAPCHGCSSLHMGVDFTPGGGAPIYAIASGIVTTHDDDTGGFGNHVIIDHGDLLGNGTDIESLYAHMQHSSVTWKVGDHIEVGDFIGTVGMTGTATGNHLHLEVHVNGTPVDPFAWLQTNT